MSEIITTIIQTELQNAENKFKPFNSSHEGYAVIKEEIDELTEIVNKINYSEEELWNTVKEDNKTFQLSHVEDIYYNSIKIIKEAIQVAAMAKRYIKDLD